MKTISILIMTFSFYNAMSQIETIDSNCIGIVGIYADEGVPFKGKVYADVNDKNSETSIIISTALYVDDTTATRVYYNGNMRYIRNSVQYYCYEQKRKWYRIYMGEPLYTLVWIKKKKTVKFYDCEELYKIKIKRKEDYELPCSVDNG